MNGKTTEFARTHDIITARLMEYHFPQRWTRRINLNPMGAESAFAEGNSTKRHRLIVTLFSVAAFAVGCKPADQQEVSFDTDCGNAAIHSDNVKKEAMPSAQDYALAGCG